ncbi:MAG: PAS domain S-box protein [Proteobacteria bacterium]|nr:PAS domain S-box protein [Pseudomonadota bacterium]
MKKPSDKRPMDTTIAKLMGLGERSVQKSYYPQLQKKIQELEKSEGRYRLLAENIIDVIWMLDLDLNIRYISPSVKNISGFSSEELDGRPFTCLLAPDHASLFSDLVSKGIKEPYCQEAGFRPAAEAELIQVNKDGTAIWIEVKISCFSGDGTAGQQILGISRDITARKQVEKEKQEIQEQLVQSQKMESIGTLAGGIAHDFNNLLTIINGYCELLLDKMEADHPLFKKISAISNAGSRAEDLTRQLLAFSRKQIYAPKILDINTTISSMDKILRRLIGEDIHVVTILDSDIGTISADRSQIEQIFTNLVVNARDALTSSHKKDFKKRITIETGQTLFPLKAVENLKLSHPGQYIYFSVSDNGRGMDREIQKRIFEPFFTTKPKNKGTGLGLSMIYGIVQQNQGNIQVYSEPDQGTLFKIYWPAASQKFVPPEQTPPQIENLSGDERILLVEDDREVCYFAANALMSLGYKVHKAFNGQEALEWIQSGHPKPDLVITDLIMPELNGKEFIQRAAFHVPALRVIYASGYTDNHIVHDGLLEEGVNFLQKPYSQKSLARMVRKILDTPTKD